MIFDLLQEVLFRISKLNISPASIRICFYLLSQLIETEKNKFYIDKSKIAENINLDKLVVYESFEELENEYIIEELEDDLSKFYKFRQENDKDTIQFNVHYNKY